MGYDSAELERVAKLFRRRMWESVAPEAIEDLGIEVQRFGPLEATAFRDEPDLPCLNEIRGAGEPGAVEHGHLADAVEWMRAHEVDYRLPVAEGCAGREEAEAWLGERGYERGRGLLTFVRDAQAPPPAPPAAGIELYELSEEAAGEGFSYLAREALELPVMAEMLAIMLPSMEDWRCYTAVLAEEDLVAATGAMLIAAGVAQLGIDATLPRARGRGCNRALLHRRLADAAAAGCHTVFAELDEDIPAGFQAARHNLLAAGFEEAYRSPTWRRPVPARTTLSR
jgi:GNAT superfamily N-acetyltransferase